MIHGRIIFKKLKKNEVAAKNGNSRISLHLFIQIVDYLFHLRFKMMKNSFGCDFVANYSRVHLTRFGGQPFFGSKVRFILTLNYNLRRVREIDDLFVIIYRYVENLLEISLFSRRCLSQYGEGWIPSNPLSYH